LKYNSPEDRFVAIWLRSLNALGSKVISAKVDAPGETVQNDMKEETYANCGRIAVAVGRHYKNRAQKSTDAMQARLEPCSVVSQKLRLTTQVMFVVHQMYVVGGVGCLETQLPRTHQRKNIPTMHKKSVVPETTSRFLPTILH